MKKVININFQGRVVPIEETAFDMLQQYINSLRTYFAAEESKDEIINDIESRIGELFAEVLKKGKSCITDEDVQAIMKSIGTPADFGEAEPASTTHTQQQQSFSATPPPFTDGRKFFRSENDKVLGGVCSAVARYLNVDPVLVRVLTAIGFSITFIPYIILWAVIPSKAQAELGTVRKRLYRDKENAFIAGICAGLANYFNVQIWVPRLLFILPFISLVFRFANSDVWGLPNIFKLTFSPGATLIYIILWLIVPEATTTSEKLQMKGEPVDLNNIKNTITEDFKNFTGRVSEGAKSARVGSAIGRVIEVIAKVIMYIIGFTVLSVLVSVFAGFGIAGIGLIPFSDYIFSNSTQTFLAWVVIVCFFFVPVVAIIVWAIRKITGKKGASGILAYSFSILWVAGLIALIFLLASVSKQFKYTSSEQYEKVTLTNATVNKLQVSTHHRNSYRFRNNILELSPFAHVAADSMFVPNLRIKIITSPTDSFQVYMVKYANGATKQQANATAIAATYPVQQVDSTLILGKGIAVSPSTPFRNQFVSLIIAVPVGKRIMINEQVPDFSHVKISINGGHITDWESNWDRYPTGTWRKNVEYIMTKDGLERTSAYTTETDDDVYELQRELEENTRRREELQQKLNNEFQQKQQELERLKNQLPPSVDTAAPKQDRFRYKKANQVQAKVTADKGIADTPITFFAEKLGA